jgi:leucyl aminopeptidase
MKGDMAGGAAVAAAAVAIARLDIPVRVTAIVPISDNVIGGDAMRPGDVLRPVAGPTIEVLNTDAEGRLILADGLGLIRREQPDLIVDVATLTGSAHVALGDQIAALFATSPAVARSLLDAASAAGEQLWELPLFQGYGKALESDVADTKNVTGSPYGGAITAALFLAKYAGDGPWAHIDMASTALTSEAAGEMVKGATGYGVRTLVELARSATELPEGAGAT